MENIRQAEMDFSANFKDVKMTNTMLLVISILDLAIDENYYKNVKYVWHFQEKHLK